MLNIVFSISKLNERLPKRLRYTTDIGKEISPLRGGPIALQALRHHA